jgi:hypothetical protein
VIRERSRDYDQTHKTVRSGKKKPGTTRWLRLTWAPLWPGMPYALNTDEFAGVHDVVGIESQFDAAHQLDLDRRFVMGDLVAF